jgi:LEA14-like dessication related protein
MKTIKKSIALLSLSTIVLASSCKQTQMVPLSFTGHNKVEFAGVSMRGIKGKVTVHIKNPNPFSIKVYKSDFDVKVNDIAIGKAKTKRKIEIPANSEVDAVLYLKSDFSNIGYFDIPKVIRTVQNKNIDLSIKGNLKSGGYFHKTKSSIDMKDTINMQEKTKPVWSFISKIGKKTSQLLSKSSTEN